MFSKKLILIFYNAATSGARKRTLLTPLGPLLFFGFLGLLIFASLWVDYLLDLPKLPGRPFNLIISLPLLIAGFLLTVWSVAGFVKKRGTPVPFNPPQELVAEGPYAYSRNPMLTGVFAMLFGVGFIMRSLSLVLVFTPFFVGLMVWEIKAVEEPELEKRFGERYVKYRASVNMFWPGRRR